MSSILVYLWQASFWRLLKGTSCYYRNLFSMLLSTLIGQEADLRLGTFLSINKAHPCRFQTLQTRRQKTDCGRKYLLDGQQSFRLSDQKVLSEGRFRKELNDLSKLEQRKWKIKKVCIRTVSTLMQLKFPLTSFIPFAIFWAPFTLEFELSQ
jgi:hypothetical protein